MSKKQTAEEFVMDFKIDHTVPYIVAKKCALVAIDKILNVRPGFPYPDEVGVEIQGIFHIIRFPEVFWNELKLEIENL